MGFKDMSLWQEGDWIAAISFGVLMIFLAAGGAIAARKEPEALGHPKGLYMLFFAEMWERFSYYGMRALLIFYLTQHWLFNDSKSNLIYGAYTSLVYITPVLGGYLADRYLGQRKAVLFGGILLMCVHFLMAVEDGGQSDPTINSSGPARLHHRRFWLPPRPILGMVGQLYKLTDVRATAPTPSSTWALTWCRGRNDPVGYLGETVGWLCFGLAGIGHARGLMSSCSARAR